VISSTTNLLLPGNILSGPVPSWFSMHSASSLYAESALYFWRVEILLVGGCIALLLILVCKASGCKNMLKFFQFKPSHHVEELQLFSGKLMCLSFLWVVLLAPLYGTATRYVDCGKIWLWITIIYTDDDVVE